MAASPYDIRKKTRNARLDEIRQQAQSRMKIASRVEDKAKLIRPGAAPTRTDPVGRARQGTPSPEGRTGPAKVVNADRFPSIAGPRQQATNRKIWDIATPGRSESRGTMVIKHSPKLGALQTYYRRKTDGKAIPIDSTGRVIRRRGTSR